MVLALALLDQQKAPVPVNPISVIHSQRRSLGWDIWSTPLPCCSASFSRSNCSSIFPQSIAAWLWGSECCCPLRCWELEGRGCGCVCCCGWGWAWADGGVVLAFNYWCCGAVMGWLGVV